MTPQEFEDLLSSMFHDSTADDDACHNGMQLEGSKRIARVAFAVSVTEASLRAAIGLGASALVAHHGLSWDGRQLPVRLDSAHRIAADAGMSVYAYHLPLDRDPVIGNSVQLLARLGLKDIEPMGGTVGLGYTGRFSAPLDVGDFLRDLKSLTTEPIMVAGQLPDKVSAVSTVTGSGGRYAQQAFAHSSDAVFLTGEMPLTLASLTENLKRVTIAMGHIASEQFGVSALASRLDAQSGVDVEVLDCESSYSMRLARNGLYLDRPLETPTTAAYLT